MLHGVSLSQNKCPPASFDEELTFDTVAWWYRTVPCSTPAPVSVLGPWLLPPALTDLFHGITITLRTREARVGVFKKFLQESLFGEYSHVACVPTPCAQGPLGKLGCSALLPQQTQGCGTGGEGDRRAAHVLCLSPSSLKLAQATAPLRPLDKDLYPWHAALHWVTSLLLRVLPCQDSQDFQGAGSQEGARLDECRCVGTHNSRIIPWPCPIAAHLCMSLSPRAVLGRVRPHLRESPLLSPRAHSCPSPPHWAVTDGRAAGAQWEPPPPLRTTAVGLHSLYIALAPFVFT